MDISIILCTYNPDKEAFGRVLAAISKLEIPDGQQVEFLIVDNNSSQAVEDRMEVEWGKWNSAIPLRIVTENKPGLLFARMKGFSESTGGIIVFFDDDNEPSPDYLKATYQFYKKYPMSGVAGPGKIEVEFIGQVAPWVPFYKGYFQQRNFTTLQYACYPDWLAFYPPGTGQTVRREVYAQYLKKVESGEFSSVGRTKASMASAEDVQLVFSSILNGYAVASVPEMQLRHLISSRKTTPVYIRRLLFGMSSSFAEAYAECFPHTRKILPYFTNVQILGVLWTTFYHKIIRKKSPKAFLFQLSESLGRMYGANTTRGDNAHSFWFFLIDLLKLR